MFPLVLVVKIVNIENPGVMLNGLEINFALRHILLIKFSTKIKIVFTKNNKLCT